MTIAEGKAKKLQFSKVLQAISLLPIEVFVYDTDAIKHFHPYG